MMTYSTERDYSKSRHLRKWNVDKFSLASVFSSLCCGCGRQATNILSLWEIRVILKCHLLPTSLIWTLSPPNTQLRCVKVNRGFEGRVNWKICWSRSCGCYSYCPSTYMYIVLCVSQQKYFAGILQRGCKLIWLDQNYHPKMIKMQIKQYFEERVRSQTEAEWWWLGSGRTRHLVAVFVDECLTID